MKILSIILLLLNYIYANSNNWDKLLHYSNNKNQITSKEFFLSGKIDPTPKEELNAIKNLLNSKYGKDIACNFPARYNYLKKNNLTSVDYDISECSDLNNFMSSFKKDRINIVFTSEYVNNPSSAFGHTMILFSDDNKSLEIGDTVHFAAKTNNKDGFFTYSYKGFNGKYSGYFVREPFYKKIYEYNTLEQRYMYIYTLDFSKEQIMQLIYHLYEIRKATFKYYFLDANCATQTTDLLNVVSPYNREENIYYLPIETINSYKKNIISHERFIPLINKLNLILGKMRKKEKKIFYNIIKTNKQINKEVPGIVKEALVYYTTFNFRKFHRIFKNYNNVMEQVYTKQIIKDKSLDPLNSNKPSNMGIGYYNQNDDNYIYLHYRPLFIDLFDIQLNNIQQSQVNTFTFDFIFNNNNSKLQKFDLINIKSYTKQSNFYKPMSWSIYSGINRENINNDLKFNNELGMGRTLSLSNNITTNILFYLGSDNSNGYIKPSLNISKYVSTKTKFGLSSYYKKYDNHHYKENQIFFTTKNDNLIYTFKYNKNNSDYKEKLLFSIKYNF